jgi:hypothetical protein
MPLLMTKKVDRQLLYLNEGAHAVYIEAADKSGGDPWTRWARNFERCLPLTLWSHFGTSLSHETWERDGKVATNECIAIANALNQGRVVVFPGDEYTIAIDKLEATSPKLHDRIYNSIQAFIKA